MIGFGTIRLGLAAKLAICVVASTAAFFTLFGYINLRAERSHSERLIEQPAAQQVLGVIDANLSLATVDAQMAQHQASLVYFLGGALALGSALAAVFIWTVVYRPVKALIDGTHRVAGGDLDYRLPVRSADELGDLAASFNKMTAEVAGGPAQKETRKRREEAGGGKTDPAPAQ